MESDSGYKRIIKATSIFGGVQIFNILIQVVRSKALAVLLGPAGMGIAGLLTTTIGLIGSMTNFGLGASAVKDISLAKSTGKEDDIGQTITVFRKWVWLTGILGCLITASLSPYLSQLTFGSKHYTLAFIWVSVTLLFSQLSSRQLVILQGLRKLKLLAKANLLGNSLGLLVTLPLYYMWGIDGIVPSLIGASVITMLASLFFARKITYVKSAVSPKQLWSEGKMMLKMGFLISMSGLLTIAGSYFVRIYIGHSGGVADVGLYTAGFAIITTYVGLVFNAMATDYYPRLSAVAQNNKQSCVTVNQQAEIAILILAPILVLFILFSKWIIILLYSTKFLPIVSMLYWSVLGMFFKAVTWSMGFLLLAKGASRLFFWNEISGNAYLMLFSILGYRVWGLAGLGIGFTVTYMIYLLQIYFVCRKYFSFQVSSGFKIVFLVQMSLAGVCFFSVQYIPGIYSKPIGISSAAFALYFSLSQLNRRVGAFSVIKRRLLKLV